MLISILIDIQYSQNAVFNFEKGLNRQNHSASSHHPVKKSLLLPAKFQSPPPQPLIAIWKTLNTKHRFFQFISWSNYIPGFQNLSPGIGDSLNWLVYKVFWWLYFSFAINLSIFPSFESCNLEKRQFTKYLLSYTVKHKSLIRILYSIANCF